jgi:hypothetical protein
LPFLFVLKGDQIQVLLPSELCPLWKSKITEGATYIMKNFKTQPNDFNLKACLHPFKLVFVGGDGGTTLKPELIPEIPDYSLNFKPFDEILEGKYHPEVLVGNSHVLLSSIYSNLKSCDQLLNSFFLNCYRHYWS